MNMILCFKTKRRKSWTRRNVRLRGKSMRMRRRARPFHQVCQHEINIMWFEAFTTTRVDKIFSGNHPHHLVAWETNISGTISVPFVRVLMTSEPWWLGQMVPEMLVSACNHLTWLIAVEDFIEINISSVTVISLISCYSHFGLFCSTCNFFFYFSSYWCTRSEHTSSSWNLTERGQYIFFYCDFKNYKLPWNHSDVARLDLTFLDLIMLSIICIFVMLFSYDKESWIGYVTCCFK